MHTREVIYEAMLRSARPALRLAAPLHPKLSRGLVGRAKAVERLVEWGEAERDLTRPLVWVHAPSVGEALMAQAIIGVLRERRPEYTDDRLRSHIRVTSRPIGPSARSDRFHPYRDLAHPGERGEARWNAPRARQCGPR